MTLPCMDNFTRLNLIVKRLYGRNAVLDHRIQKATGRERGLVGRGHFRLLCVAPKFRCG